MKVAILSRQPQLYSTQRLIEGCQKAGHEVDVLDTLRFSIQVEQGHPGLMYENHPICHYDAVIPRIGAATTFFGTAVVRQFEQMGVFCLNSSQAINNARDKLRAFQILSRHNIGIPHTAFVKHRQSVMPTIQSMGGAPVIIKLLEGTQGIGVILADTNKVAEAIIETMQSTKQNVLIQKFVKESRGKDVRVFVVGGKVVAAMRRTAKGDEFRSNVHRGGSVEAVELDTEYETNAVRAAHIMGLNVAGIDILESHEGPKIIEVNSSPGLQGIEQATGVDIATCIAEYLEEEVMFPEIDYRQRLKMNGGYGIVELKVHPESELAHKPLGETVLIEWEVRVLSIQRGSVTIPAPKKVEELLPGDKLLCYGQTSPLRSLAKHPHSQQA